MKSTLLALALLAAPSFAATPAETAIQQALGSIARQPAYYANYNALALAYARRARETADAQFYGKAEDAVRKSLALQPGNYEARKMETWLDLGRQEFARALQSATELNRQVPDDVAVYGYLVDANVELGNYKEAIAAAQWMLDLRPGNVPALVRASYLRELHGNLPGARELMQMALETTPPTETEDRAWMLTQLAHLEFAGGDLAKAEQDATAALEDFSDYPYALTVLAQVRGAQGRFDDAVELLAKRWQAAPRAETLYALAEAEERAGRDAEARVSFQKFETLARGESTTPDNSNRELVAYYVDHAHDPAKALEIARREMARRHDIFTRDAYAWALAASGDYEAAGREMAAALATGVKDQKLLYHAGSIALARGEKDKLSGMK